MGRTAKETNEDSIAPPCSALAEEVARLAQGLRDDAHTCDRILHDEADRMIDIADRLDALIKNGGDHE